MRGRLKPVRDACVRAKPYTIAPHDGITPRRQCVTRATVQKAFDLYARLFARRALFRAHKGLFYLAARGLGLYNLTSLELSGETWIVNKLAREPGCRIIFDVGANEGDFVRLIRRALPAAEIHAFEPHPRTFDRLRTKYPEAERLHLNCVGLGASSGEATLFDLVGSEGTNLASLHREAVEVAGRSSTGTTIEVATVDEYCSTHDIRRIDLLKIDTEGNELAVLRGAKRMIGERAVRYIQFEFNEMNVVSRSFLADFRRELPGYRLHRLLVDGPVSIEPYAPFMAELFGYQNILATRLDA